MSKKKTINVPKDAMEWIKVHNEPVNYEFPEAERKGSLHIFEKGSPKADEKAHNHEQLQEDDFVLSIIQAGIDREDYSEVCYRNEAFLVFYERNDKLHFATVWQKTGVQLYGEVVQLEHTEDDKAKERTETTSYLWNYSHTGTGATGTAIIWIRLTHRPVAVAFELSILRENAEMLLFKGYVNGSLNWKPYF